MTVFSKNLKRFRVGKNLTQEQAAEALGVSTQTVSRWECSTTLPDVTILPEIAKLYCITIDDLFKETSVAYDNYAQRLGSVFEATRNPEDFLRADLEYRKLSKYTTEDLRLYGILHQQMMHYCMENALALFDRVINQGPEADPKTYWRTRRQKGYLLYKIGRNNETIQELLPLVKADSPDLNEWICLIQAYQFAEDYETAWVWAQKAQKKFPEDAVLHIDCGDICRARKQYDEAFFHWKRALELEPLWCDAAFSMASCYEEMGDFASAYAMYNQIADNLESRGFEAEVTLPRTLAHKCQERISI